MAVEAKRGCGYRKVGGLYLVFDAPGMPCDRLPIIIERCPCCGEGLKFTRGWTWIDPIKLFEGDHGAGCSCDEHCPACYPSKFFAGHENSFENKAGLLWVGEKFYSVESFLREAADLGVSKRIKAIPRGFIPGKTWVFFAHMKGGMRVKMEDEDLFDMAPAIFMALRPRGFEKIVLESVHNDYLKVRDWAAANVGDPAKEFSKKEIENHAEIEALVKANIKPIPVPDDDADHNPSALNGNGDEE